MRTTAMKTRGFTLIETMIAIGLGLVICYTAFAALRLSSQSVAVINRLSLENQLMRAGVTTVLHELDTWEAYDNAGAGFRPLNADTLPFTPVTFSGSTKLDHAQHKPHAWWRGDPIRSNNRNRGDFALFANAAHADPDHAWYDNYVWQTVSHLGYYGLIDYGPCNMYYVYRDAAGNVPTEFYLCGYGPFVFYNACGYNNHEPRNWSGVQYTCIYSLTTDPWYIANNISRRLITGCSYNWFNWRLNLAENADEWGGSGRVVAGRPPPPPQNYWNDVPESIDLAAQRPGHWPNVRLSVRHFWAQSTLTDAGSIELSSPVTGQQMRLYLTNVATSLRGARMQRNLDTVVP
jgi:type II secretory pathway pseudopilin PulG